MLQGPDVYFPLEWPHTFYLIKVSQPRIYNSNIGGNSKFLDAKIVAWNPHFR